jgi:hypothetical protein
MTAAAAAPQYRPVVRLQHLASKQLALVIVDPPSSNPPFDPSTSAGNAED